MSIVLFCYVSVLKIQSFLKTETKCYALFSHHYLSFLPILLKTVKIVTEQERMCFGFVLRNNHAKKRNP